MDGSGSAEGSKVMGHLSPWGWKLSLRDWYLPQHRFSGVVYLKSQFLIAAMLQIVCAHSVYSS